MRRVLYVDSFSVFIKAEGYVWRPLFEPGTLQSRRQNWSMAAASAYGPSVALPEKGKVVKTAMAVDVEFPTMGGHGPGILTMPNGESWRVRCHYVLRYEIGSNKWQGSYS